MQAGLPSAFATSSPRPARTNPSRSLDNTANLSMTPELMITLGDELYSALNARNTLEPLTDRCPDMTIEDAYRVQQRVVGRRLDAGETVVGKKIGVTSKAVMDMLGVYQPDFGYLLSGMVYGEGQTIALDTLIQPKAEGEIAFILKKDLIGPGITNAEVLAATECVMPCFEIVDSRIRDWKIKIQDTVADNASCGVFVLGDRAVSARAVDLSTCGMVLEKNGEIIGTGAGAAALGSPVNAVAWLANTLGRLGIPLKAGEVILSGALAAMAVVKPGDNFRVSIGGIGSCSVRFA
ncbi:2-keto-4-pentenoate hydratase [Thiomonas delicata]|uniref:2-keto-4-pentenoate hydratase n=2 Tax=Thiomonas delicata TaxID=364030 RepID=A0A238D934_THIDL|nr:2-keto-4-pentenoate hydratase [Thiomonas delicata]